MPKHLWQPGVSANPAGRPPKNRALSDLLRTALSHKGPDGVTMRQAMMDRLATMAVSGDLDAIKVVLERIDGKVPDVRQVTGEHRITLGWDDGDGD